LLIISLKLIAIDAIELALLARY